MKLLIYGAGAIGLTYGWLLSGHNEVHVLVRPEKLDAARGGFDLTVHDLRTKARETRHVHFAPPVVSEAGPGYDAVLLCVNRCQLGDVLPGLGAHGADVIFMQNNWDLPAEAAAHLAPGGYLFGFPSQVGGGREGRAVEVNLYPEGTVLAEPDGSESERLGRYKALLEQAGLAVETKKDMAGWMRVHYLQQSISAGAVLEAGGYDSFANSRAAVKKMVYAFREGVRVCAAFGVDTKRTFPASMFRLPAPLVAYIMGGMFRGEDTRAMVTGHMKQGLAEWAHGYYEVLAAGEEKGIDMPHWRSYKPAVDAWMAGQM